MTKHKHAKQRTQNATTLSTRFEPKEIETLRKAAEVKGWSLSKLLREGAYHKACHILNVNGDAVHSLRMILTKIVQQLFGADFSVPPGDEANVDLDVFLQDLESEGVGVTSLDTFTFMNFITAIETVGEELAPMLSEEHHRFAAGRTAGGDLRSKLISPSSLKPDAELEIEPNSGSTAPRKRLGKSGKKKK